MFSPARITYCSCCGIPSLVALLTSLTSLLVPPPGLFVRGSYSMEKGMDGLILHVLHLSVHFYSLLSHPVSVCLCQMPWLNDFAQIASWGRWEIGGLCRLWPALKWKIQDGRSRRIFDSFFVFHCLDDLKLSKSNPRSPWAPDFHPEDESMRKKEFAFPFNRAEVEWNFGVSKLCGWCGRCFIRSRRFEFGEATGTLKTHRFGRGRNWVIIAGRVWVLHGVDD